MRSSVVSKKAVRCGAVAYRLAGSVTRIVSTLRGSNPASTCRRATRLRTITPAPVSRTTDNATSPAISNRRGAQTERGVASPAFLEGALQIASTGAQRG